MDALYSMDTESGMKFDNLALRRRAFEIIRTRSFSRGEMTLASGQTSKFYFDMKPAMLDPEGASVLADLVFEKIADIDVDAIGGLQMGAVPLIAPIVAESYAKDRRIPGFFIRSEIKDHGTMKLIEGYDDLENKNVVILDDVTTSGGSAMKAVKVARNAGANIALVLSIVDRGEGACELYEKEGIPFDSLFTAGEFLDG